MYIHVHVHVHWGQGECLAGDHVSPAFWFNIHSLLVPYLHSLTHGLQTKVPQKCNQVLSSPVSCTWAPSYISTGSVWWARLTDTRLDCWAPPHCQCHHCMVSPPSQEPQVEGDDVWSWVLLQMRKTMDMRTYLLLAEKWQYHTREHSCLCWHTFVMSSCTRAFTCVYVFCMPARSSWYMYLHSTGTAVKWEKEGAALGPTILTHMAIYGRSGFSLIDLEWDKICMPLTSPPLRSQYPHSLRAQLIPPWVHSLPNKSAHTTGVMYNGWQVCSLCNLQCDIQPSACIDASVQLIMDTS